MIEKSKILLVEDDIDMRETCKQSLEEAGYVVVEASSPKDAEPVLLRETIDLVITDLQMGRVSGLDVAGEAKAMYPDMTVFILTGCNDDKTARKAFLLIFLLGEGSSFVGVTVAILGPVARDVEPPPPAPAAEAAGAGGAVTVN